MDEPLSNLDAKLRVQMRTEISRLQQQLETTMVYVTHDQTEAMTLGDRIAVMRAGVLQQVGSPIQLYNHPNNLFVAGFIGSPSMNFLPGELSGDTVELPIGTLRIPDRLRSRLQGGPGGGRRGVIAGLRPEHFEDASLVADRYFVVEAGRVAARELEELAQDTGASDLPASREGSQIVARLDADSRVRQGQPAELWFETDKLQLFDPESGQSLLAPEDRAAQPTTVG
jgi:multiple sugar transport system ATP-binding protein